MYKLDYYSIPRKIHKEQKYFKGPYDQFGGSTIESNQHRGLWDHDCNSYSMWSIFYSTVALMYFSIKNISKFKKAWPKKNTCIFYNKNNSFKKSF